MQIDWVEVEDFRGIDRLSIDLDVLTTVIGEHHYGKSSLLRAIARVLDPREPELLPSFSEADFHRPPGDDAERASSLAITLGLGADDDDDHAAALPGIKDGGLSIRILAQRSDEGEPATSVDVLDRAGVPRTDLDARRLLAELRRRHPAIIVGGPRPSIGRPEPRPAGGQRLRSMLLGAAQPQAPLSWDELGDVREDLLQAGGRLAAQLGPVPDRPRSVQAMTDTPRPLVTDLGSALAEGAGQQRRIAALWLLVSVLDAMPAEGLAETAEPILLFDDIEANLHPTWLAALCAVAFNLPFQQVVATHSPEVLAWVPLRSLRRLVRRGDAIEARAVQPHRYSSDELRRLTFHVRLNRSGSFFARCWVLVEGETEAWLIPELALLAGAEFPVEGIRVIEFAQCGVAPLLKLADDLGIGWLLVADGDHAGQGYARTARDHQQLDGPGTGVIVVLPAQDIERYLFTSGYADVIRRAYGLGGTRSVDRLILGAVDRVSKPGLALEILAAADERGPEGVPPVIRDLVATALRLARA
jgi:putative ATP-dependent endonuclease of the OLD family